MMLMMDDDCDHDDADDGGDDGDDYDIKDLFRKGKDFSTLNYDTIFGGTRTFDRDFNQNMGVHYLGYWDFFQSMSYMHFLN